MISLREVPLSGDDWVDWTFKQFVFFLRKETLAIKRKKKAFGPGQPSSESYPRTNATRGWTGRAWYRDYH